MELGMIRLGRMGANMVQHLRRAGHQCVVYELETKVLPAIKPAGSDVTTCERLRKRPA